MYELILGGFLNWRISAKSPIRQIKNLAKVYRYTVIIDSLQNGIGIGKRQYATSLDLTSERGCYALY